MALWVTFTHTFTHKHSHKYSKHIQLVPRKKICDHVFIRETRVRIRVRVSGSFCGRMRDYEATTVRFMIWLCFRGWLFKYIMLFFAIIIIWTHSLVKAAVSFPNLIGLAFNFFQIIFLIVCHGKIIIKKK